MRWLRRMLQRAIFAPEPEVCVGGVLADALLIRSANGKPLLAIDKRGYVGVTLIKATYNLLPPTEEATRYRSDVPPQQAHEADAKVLTA